MTEIKTIIKNSQNAGHYLNGVVKRRMSGNGNYQLAFNRESNGCWYIDLPEWQGAHASLAMVAGADLLLEYVGQGNPRVEVSVVKSNVPVVELDNEHGYFRCDQLDRSLFGGATYQVNLKDFPHTIWLCPVTLFVLGEYPKHLYIPKSADDLSRF